MAFRVKNQMTEARRKHLIRLNHWKSRKMRERRRVLPELVARGLSGNELVRMFGVCRSAIQADLTALGLRIRRGPSRSKDEPYKLSINEIKDIAREANNPRRDRTLSEIAARYGVSTTLVSEIATGARYSAITGVQHRPNPKERRRSGQLLRYRRKTP